MVHICGCSQDWTADQFVETTINDLKKNGQDKVVMALSGGVDSSVAAILVPGHRENLYYYLSTMDCCAKDEFEQVLSSYQVWGSILKVLMPNQSLRCPEGLTDPEAKRKGQLAVRSLKYLTRKHIIFLTSVAWAGYYLSGCNRISIRKGPICYHQVSS